MTGKLSNELFASIKLDQMYLDCNKHTETLPESIGVFPKLKILSLHSTLMIGYLLN